MNRPPERWLLDEGYAFIPLDQLTLVQKDGSYCLKVDEMMALLLADILREAATLLLKGPPRQSEE